MVGYWRRRAVLGVIALAACAGWNFAAQGRGGGHGSSAPAASGGGSKASGSTSDWRTHIHPNSAQAAKKTKKPSLHDISITKKIDSSSPKMMSAKPSGTFKPNKNRIDPYKDYKFR